ncbi:human WRAP53 orthlog Gnr1 [Schizosaccharomyces pombe]|uniref:Guanine nucleotide-binding protein negative regulator 1 n=1 Tax=Schizosaccharomyces pombe (strain 972 / ATCC 24843) TaxID=284812 RepID=GNR1_SCHPO|nr:heterotrimeric G protein beta subunit Gnr1 [Schizosaccharomyces pombe]O59762.1 RecName: Full=Guanine nucleotide-binding protein negative regulator 1; Short=G protein negative regulator 1; AltName: Full=WD repeat-containing protein gnr1 [Schizosaccharomyces pombe 972h-]CAA18997.1 heterotrimeric G protein beta subunit Gnr1 [Schizosaccharomyces pombe]|eukprot:NP_587950.1 heterotrimeric G protein beta subunit Gnr1 [Schizosaccharomyces pombe]
MDNCVNSFEDQKDDLVHKKKSQNFGYVCGSINLGTNVIAQSPTKPLNFFHSSRWSPDGSTILSLTEDQCLNCWNVPFSDLSKKADGPLNFSKHLSYKYQSPETVYSYSWYSRMKLDDPSSNLFAVSSRDQPIKLINFTTGKNKASYHMIDHQERYQGSHCLQFTNDGEYLIAGDKNCLHHFNIRTGCKEPVMTTVTHGYKVPLWEFSLKGIQSCFSLNPMDSKTLAVGTYSNRVGIYNDCGRRPCQLEFSIERGNGVTHLQWCEDGEKLYVGSRCSDKIEVWDIRYVRDMVYALEGHRGDTNQRILFDTDKKDEILAGGTDGSIRRWRNKDLVEETHVTGNYDLTVNTVQANPINMQIKCVCYGNRIYKYEKDESEEEDESKEKDLWTGTVSALQVWMD